MDGLEIKIARIRRGIRQQDLARMVGIGKNRMWEIEHDWRTPSPEVLERIMKAIEGDGNMPMEGGK